MTLSQTANRLEGCQVKERMTQQIADMVKSELGADGVAVVVQAEHSCMSNRDIRKPGSQTLISALRGVFKTNPSTRAEVIALVNGGR